MVSYIYTPKDLDHQVDVGDMSHLRNVGMGLYSNMVFDLYNSFLTRARSTMPPMSAERPSSAYISSTHRYTSSMLKEGFPLRKMGSEKIKCFSRVINIEIIY